MQIIRARAISTLTARSSSVSPSSFSPHLQLISQSDWLLRHCRKFIILSLDLSALCEFAPHAKVEKSAIEGKGKLSVIRAIRQKIEDSFENLTGDDQMECVDELIAHLGPPPLEGMEHEYGQEELETKGDLKQLQKELGELESKQKLVEERLAEIKKEKPADLVKGEGAVNFPVKGVEQSIFCRDFKILGVVGELGQKDKLGYQARSPGCQECRRKKEGDRCPHCYLCGGPNHIARYCQAKYRSHPGNAPRLPPRDRE